MGTKQMVSETLDLLASAVDPAAHAGATSEKTYADLRDRVVAARLLDEDRAEEAGLDPFERITCRIHRRWLYQCISSPVHIIAVTGHRWCRGCAAPASVAVDELTGSVRVVCTRCGRCPAGRATQQIVRTCTASVAAAYDR
jgi:hypothetical protein